jgi:hypothetical protein
MKRTLIKKGYFSGSCSPHSISRILAALPIDELTCGKRTSSGSTKLKDKKMKIKNKINIK